MDGSSKIPDQSKRLSTLDDGEIQKGRHWDRLAHFFSELWPPGKAPTARKKLGWGFQSGRSAASPIARATAPAAP